MIVVLRNMTTDREFYQTHNVMSVFLLVCIGMEQHGVYMSSQSGLHQALLTDLHMGSCDRESSLNA